MENDIDKSVPEVTLTDSIKKALEDVGNFKEIDEKLKNECKELGTHGDTSQGKAIPLRLIQEVYKSLKSCGQQIYLHELLEGAELVLHPPVVPPRNPELEARVRQLRIEEENRHYQRMTENVDPMQRKNQTFSFQHEVKSMNRQLTSVINFIITVIAGFAFGYKLVEYTYGRILPMQMMVGLVFGTVIFFVDLYFMLKYTPL